LPLQLCPNQLGHLCFFLGVSKSG